VELVVQVASALQQVVGKSAIESSPAQLVLPVALLEPVARLVLPVEQEQQVPPARPVLPAQ
jgi:hypothetical protein